MTTTKKGLRNALESAQAELAKIDKEAKPKTYARQEEIVKAYEIALNQSIRAKKAEKKATPKNSPKETETPKNEPSVPDFTTQIKNTRALKDVHDDDFEFVLNWAKSQGKEPYEVMADDDLQAVLNNRSEKRKAADATNTGKGKRKASKLSHEAIIRKAEAGEDVDMEALAEARMAQRLARVQK